MRIDITPIGKPRLTQRDRWAKRPAVVRYWAFCDQLREKVGDWVLPPEVSILFYLPMPNSWSEKKKRLMNMEPHQQRPDIDNLMKAVLDALCKDDSYVYYARVGKYWAREGYIELDSL